MKGLIKKLREGEKERVLSKSQENISGLEEGDINGLNQILLQKKNYLIHVEQDIQILKLKLL